MFRIIQKIKQYLVKIGLFVAFAETISFTYRQSINGEEFLLVAGIILIMLFREIKYR